MSLLVTGATGFVGSWLTRHLCNTSKQSVRVLVRKSSDLSELSGLDVETHFGDVTDYESLLRATKGVDTVFHLAGVIGYSKAMRPAMNKVNVNGTDNVVRACLENGVRRLVYMSSVVAIGASFDGKSPLTEDSPFNVSHLNLGYFETKKAAEEIVTKAVKEKGLDAVILNPSTIYGPGDAKKGSRKTQVKVARGEFPFYTSGGVNIVNITDAIEATCTAWTSGAKGERYILAGENITIKQLFGYIAKAAGVSPPKYGLPNVILHSIGWVGDRLESMGKKGPISSENAWTASMFHWFDSSKAQRELGLKVTPAEESIRQSVQWMRENGYLN